MSTPELEAIAELAEPLTYERPDQSGTRRKGGKVQTPVAAVVAFSGEVQPASGKALRHLPEGKDARDLVTIWTGTELFNDDEIKATLAGQTMNVGEAYIVQNVERWPEGEFFEVQALRRTGELK